MLSEVYAVNDIRSALVTCDSSQCDCTNMRNLRLLSSASSLIPEGFEGLIITGTAVDLDTGTIYSVSEHVTVGEVNIQVWKLDEKQHLVSSNGAPVLFQTNQKNYRIHFQI